MAGFGLNLKSVLYFKNQCLTENLGFLNPPLLQAAKRYMLASQKSAIQELNATDLENKSKITKYRMAESNKAMSQSIQCLS